MKHYIIGSCPPPIGGINVYVYRYSRQLQSEGKDVEVVDLPKLSAFGRLRALLGMTLSPKPAVYELNCYSFYAMIALILRPFPGKIVFYHHGHGILDQMGPAKRIIFKCFLQRIDTCRYVSAHLVEHYRKLGFLPREDKICIQPAFISPPLDEEESILRTYDDETLSFVAMHSPLIVTNGYKITFQDGIDLYGIDMCIELASKLKTTFPNVGVFCALADVGDNDYFAEANRRIESLGLRDSFRFMTGQHELWPLLKKADLMVRPTSVDGYGISIAESLYFGCPAVASDVCDRPAGTIIFRSRDMADFTEKVLSALKDGGHF